MMTLEELEYLKISAEAEICKRNFSEFVKRAWKHVDDSELIWNWHMDAVCTALEACAKGEINRLVINIPPGHCKSLLVSVFFNAWLWIRRPSAQFLSTSHSEEFSSRDSRKTRNLILSDWYQARWPLRMSDDQDAKTNFINADRGQRSIKSFESLTGGRGNFLLIDDPISANHALSKAHREKVKTIFLESVPSRLNDLKKDCIIIIAQRLHLEDIVGLIEKQDLRYEFVIIPAEYTGNKVINETLNIIDPRENIGELLFDKKFPGDELQQLKKSLGTYSYSAQYQQNPVPRTDGFFEVDAIDLYDKHPPLSEMNIYMTSDHAVSGKGDNNVVRIWGIDSKSDFWLLDTFVDKCTIDKALGIKDSTTGITVSDKGALALVKQWKPLCWFPENDNTWKSQENYVKRAMRSAGIYTNIKPISTHGGTKEVKAQALDSHIRLGKVHMPREGVDTQETLAEYKNFPVAGFHDDRVDADANLARAMSLFPGVVTSPVKPDGPVDGYQKNRMNSNSNSLAGFY